jgi:hypothetical protein
VAVNTNRGGDVGDAVMSTKITPEDKAFLAGIELRMPTKYDRLHWESRERAKVIEALMAKRGRRS